MLVDELGQRMGVQLASLREVGVSADLAAEVVLRLSVPGEVDGARRDMNVHQPELTNHAMKQMKCNEMFEGITGLW